MGVQISSQEILSGVPPRSSAQAELPILGGAPNIQEFRSSGTPNIKPSELPLQIDHFTEQFVSCRDRLSVGLESALILDQVYELQR
jgi:hypothetical protein